MTNHDKMEFIAAIAMNLRTINLYFINYFVAIFKKTQLNAEKGLCYL